MKEIEFPQSRQVGEEMLTSFDVLHRVVFSQPIWRQRAHISHALSLIEKTSKPNTRLRVSDSELESLEKGCELPGLQVTPPALNAFFLQVIAAIYAAKPVAEDKPK